MACKSEKRTIIYCRESRDEYGENYERIEVQRDILLGFCRQQGLDNIVEIIMDDNVSGTKFARLNGVVEKARSGLVDVIVFKDASRLGRNLRESLNFLHTIEECGVEVLFESERYDETMFPLLAWFNEQRAREDSQKVRRVFRHKMENGELLIKSVYGYDKEGKALVVNEDEAAIVGRIFAMFLDGHGANEIATVLNYDGTPTPSQSRLNSETQQIAPAWNRQHIYRILTNRVYTGDMVYSRKERKSFKSTRVITKPQSDWIIVQNHHEAIISAQDFERVQALRKRHSVQRTATVSPRLFSGLLVCGRCGYQLVQRVRSGRRDAYICGKYSREGCIKDEVRENYGCNSHHIGEAELRVIALRYFEEIIGNDGNFTARLLNLQRERPDGSNGRKAERLRQDIEKYQTVIAKIFDEHVNGGLNISKELVNQKLDEYNQKISEVRAALAALEAAMPKRESFSPERIKKSLGAMLEQGLSNRVMKNCFERIIYYLPGEITAEARELHKLPDEVYEYILENGGLIFKVNQF